MDTSTAQWPQGIGLVKPIVMDQHNQDQEITNGNACNRAINEGERRATRPQEQLNCPRCNSTNTKFCYYNNYSLTQPRYFCKGCRRYWTEGGSLRNVPIGGGSRKNKRSSTYKLPDLNPHDQNPNNKQSQAGHDLNLSFQGTYMQLPKMENHQNESNSNNPCSNSSSSSALDLLRSTGIAGSFIDSNTSLYSSSSAPAGGFSLQSTHHQLMSFPVMDALASNGNNNTGRLFFPFGDFSKQVTAPVAAGPDHQDNKGNNNANRYWNGMLQGGGGGSSW